MHNHTEKFMLKTLHRRTQETLKQKYDLPRNHMPWVAMDRGEANMPA